MILPVSSGYRFFTIQYMYDDMIPAAPAIHIQRIQDVHGTSHATNFYASAEETFQGQWIMRIRTPTSILRDWGSGDIGSLVRHANNPRVAAMMRDGFPSPYTHEDARRFIDLATTPGPHLFLAIEVDGKACGGIGIHPLEDVRRRSAEIGYWLSESCWGRGIATDAVRAIVPVAFGTFDIIRLQAGIFSSNRASMRVLEKCGFVREAVHTNAITKNGMTMDEIVYVCLQ